VSGHRVAVIGGTGSAGGLQGGLKWWRHRRGPRHTDFDLGRNRFVRTGDVLPDDTLEELRGFEAILLGGGPAIGDTTIPPGTSSGPAAPAAVRPRPLRQPPPVHRRAGLDRRGCEFVVVRENTEGTYAGEGGFLRKGTPHEVATQAQSTPAWVSSAGVRFAFALAAHRPERRLTLVHKTNVLTFAGDLWQRTVNEVAPEFGDVALEYNHVDAACIYCRAAAPLRRHRHRQPLRGHPDRPSRRGSGGIGFAARRTQTGEDRAVCSSRYRRSP